MCISTDSPTVITDQTSLPVDDGFTDPLADAVAVRVIPGDLQGLLDLWAEDIRRGASVRHMPGLKGREVRAINAGLGEARVIYGIVSVLRDGLSSAMGTRNMIEARLGRIARDLNDAETKKLRRVHAVREFTVSALLTELEVSLAGGGTGVAILAA